MLRSVYDYIDFTLFGKRIFNFLFRCSFKNFSNLNSIDVTQFILRCWRVVCAACGTVWSSFVGVIVRQVVLWCLRVCRHHVVVSRGN